MTGGCYAALLFDFDYTLADSSEGVVECVSYAFGQLGEPCPPAAAIRATIGLSLEETYRALTVRESAAGAAGFRAFFVQRADQVMTACTRIYPSVRPALERLTERGMRLGIVSTKFRYRIEAILGRDGLREFFALVIGGEDVRQPKPDPAGVLEALRRLGVDAGRAAYIGDSEVDGQTASRAGIDFMAVLTGATGEEALRRWRPVAVIGELAELPGVVG